MKKTIILTTLILSTMLFAGCMGMGDSVRNGMQNTAEKVQQTADSLTQSAKQTVDKSQFIGEEKAKQKALEHAGLTSDGVTFEKTNLDFDDGVWEYEVDFRHSGYEYDVNIDAKTGEVIKYDKEYKD